MLALLAPSLLGGIALFVLYFVGGILIFGVVMILLFRWRIRKLQKQMQDQFGEQTGHTGFYGQGSRGSRSHAHNTASEGEVRLHVPSETPEKRVADDVGDYVEFEETKNEQ